MVEEKEYVKKNSEVLTKLQANRSRKNITTVIIALILFAILIFIGFSFYLYFKSPEHKLNLGANIEEAKISDDGKTAYIKLVGGINYGNITKIKFIFKDAEGKEYNYETSEGASEISVPFKRSFFDWFFGLPRFVGKYNYEIKANEIDLNDFNSIEEVSVSFEYETEKGEETETPVLDTTKTTTAPATTTGGGDGGTNGPSPEPTPPTCTDSDTGINYYEKGTASYSTTTNEDYCNNSILTEYYCNGTLIEEINYDCSSEGKVCLDGRCVGLIECTDDENCSYLNVECGYGVCNASNKCEIAYNVSGTICNDSLFCTINDACNGAGNCRGKARDCSDAIACTDDNCNEINDGCDNIINNSKCNYPQEICNETQGCIANPCYGITACSDYTDSDNCTNNPCGVVTGCQWNLTTGTGQCEETLAMTLKYSTNEDTSINITLTSSIIGDFIRTTNPSHGSIKNNTALEDVNFLNITYIPTLNYNGNDYFIYNVSDGINSEIIRVNITIIPVDDAPKINIPNLVFAIYVGETSSDKTYKISVTEVDGDVLEYSALKLPQGTIYQPQFDTSTGTLTWTITLNDLNGQDNKTFTNINFTVKDKYGIYSDSKIVNITIRQGKEYYVDANNGGDSNDGSSGSPWKNLNRSYTWYAGAGAKVQEGDVVIFRDGNYGTFRENTGDGQARLFYRNNWITYKADAGHTPTLDRISIQNADKWGGAGDGRSYLIFDGFRILNGFYSQYTSYVKVLNCNITLTPAPYDGFYAPYFYSGGEGINVKHAHYITIENNNISNAYRGIGVVDDSSDITIRGNIIHQIGEDGLVITATNSLIENNTIYDISAYRTTVQIFGVKTGDFIPGENVILEGTGATGIVNKYQYEVLKVWQTSQVAFKNEWKAGRGTTMVGQTSNATLNVTKIDPEHTDAVTLAGGSNIIFRNNKLIRSFGGGSDGQALKPDSPKNVEMYNNLIVACVGIIGPRDTNNFNMYNNTIYSNMSNPGCHSIEIYDGEHENTIINNMYNNIITRLSIRGDNAIYYSRVINHWNNIFGNNPITGPTQAYPFSPNETELVNTVPEFVNVENYDFRPLISSVACNGSINPKGVAVGALPCVCTNDTQCMQVFGAGATCDINIGECVGSGIGTFSPFREIFIIFAITVIILIIIIINVAKNKKFKKLKKRKKKR